MKTKTRQRKHETENKKTQTNEQQQEQQTNKHTQQQHQRETKHNKTYRCALNNPTYTLINKNTHTHGSVHLKRARLRKLYKNIVF